MAQQTMPANKHRFINNVPSELQEVNRRPISGYQQRLLVSLEEAVQSIIPFVPDVMNYAATAKTYCKQNTILTVNESAAIYLYTMPKSFYEILNQTLRSENPYALEPWFAYLKLLITALKKLPSCPITVWRGIHGIVDSNFIENSRHIWWSVNSCSSYLNVADSFAGENGTLFCIETIYGKNITAYSANHCEEEIVLMPGTHLRVKCTSSKPEGLSIVHLQEW